MAEIQSQNPLEAFVTEFGTRINEIEEKQRLLKDRLLLVGENLISTKEEQESENIDFKKQLKQIETEIQTLKHLNKRIIYELQNLARKSELEILDRQFKIFSPLEFARIKDVREIVREEIKKLKKK